MTADLVGLEEDIEARQAEREATPSRTCRVRELLSELPPDDAKRLRRIIAGRAYAGVIADELAKRDIDLPKRIIERHRRGLRGAQWGCTCTS